MKLADKQIREFTQTVLEYYGRSARQELPWRQMESDGSFAAYKVWVSELMLQQTQVNRVIPKYSQFLQTFPTIQKLADAELGDVLTAWQGLGYNRRAKYLWQAANEIIQSHDAIMPTTIESLTSLPGIGHNTAGAILAYTHNKPALFIETNIRSVYFHHFFNDQTEVTDAEIRDLLSQTLDQANPRQFYWALMDYGTYLKRQKSGATQKSKHYTKQSKFQGSARQIRGETIKQLSKRPINEVELLSILNDVRAPKIIEQLQDEQLIKRIQDMYMLA